MTTRLALPRLPSPSCVGQQRNKSGKSRKRGGSHRGFPGYRFKSIDVVAAADAAAVLEKKVAEQVQAAAVAVAEQKEQEYPNALAYFNQAPNATSDGFRHKQIPNSHIGQI